MIAVLLEGINFTLPEIQTLLVEVTVGGHKLSDQQIAINQVNAWHRLFEDVKSEKFEFSAKYSCELHALAGKEEALEGGCFRSGSVTIAGTDYMPLEVAELASIYDAFVLEVNEFKDIYEKATLALLRMARAQFFYDVNKRVGRFMMNGILLTHGYPVINVPAMRNWNLTS